jgi:hypothetical protein
VRPLPIVVVLMGILPMREHENTKLWGCHI